MDESCVQKNFNFMHDNKSVFQLMSVNIILWGIIRYLQPRHAVKV